MYFQPPTSSFQLSKTRIKPSPMSLTSSIRVIIFCAIIASISSCKPDYYFEGSAAMDQNIWTYANKLTYTIPIRDTQEVYNIYLNIDHSTEYASEYLSYDPYSVSFRRKNI